MRESVVRIAAWALRQVFGRTYHRYLAGLERLEVEQARVLRRLTRGLSRTCYGVAFGLRCDDDYAEFSRKLPAAIFEDLEPWLNRQISGEKCVISAAAFVHTEPTSGSQGRRKSIPYTQAMMAAFSRMFAIWAYDLLSQTLRPTTGKIFISQSPQTSTRRETQYLDGWLEMLLSPFLVRLKGCHSDFLMDVSISLLSEPDLEIISVWSPSYLTVVLDFIITNRTDIAAHLPPDRASVLEHEINWTRVWPKLQLISCWDEAMARPFADSLRRHFPDVPVLGKGLLATEAAISVPILSAEGSLPLYDAVFYEFVDPEGVLFRLHQLQQDQTYEILITTDSGLIRYRLGDLVQVTGFHRGAPVLRFEGRSGHVSDMVGEKLSDAFVREALLPLIPTGRFAVVPRMAVRPNYVLICESAGELANDAEAALAQAHHYALARRQGQLGPLEVVETDHIPARLKDLAGAQGQDFGHTKDMALISNPAQAKAILESLML